MTLVIDQGSLARSRAASTPGNQDVVRLLAPTGNCIIRSCDSPKPDFMRLFKINFRSRVIPHLTQSHHAKSRFHCVLSRIHGHKINEIRREFSDLEVTDMKIMKIIGFRAGRDEELVLHPQHIQGRGNQLLLLSLARRLLQWHEEVRGASRFEKFGSCPQPRRFQGLALLQMSIACPTCFR